MSKAGAPTMGTFRARWARRLGLDRNPLRRTVDRMETFVRLTVLILLLAGVPAGLFVAGGCPTRCSCSRPAPSDRRTARSRPF